MAVKKRRATKTTTKGVAKAAPTSSGGIKKRTIIPVEPEVPEFSGELGNTIKALSESGHYGKPFKKLRPALWTQPDPKQASYPWTFA